MKAEPTLRLQGQVTGKSVQIAHYSFMNPAPSVVLIEAVDAWGQPALFPQTHLSWELILKEIRMMA